MDILVDVVGEQLSRLLFDRAVLPNRFGVAPKVIAEGKMAVQLLRGLRADIEMVLLQMRLAVVFEGLPIADAEIAFVASALPRDKANDLVPRAGYPLHTVHIQGLTRPVWSPSNLKLPILMVKSKGEAGKIIDGFKPDLIVGTGGFACWPTCRMGIKKGIPTALHESNAIPGKAVQKLKDKADLVMVNFAATIDRLGKNDGRIIRVGNPMMPGFTTVSREEARRRLGLAPTDLYVLSFGGSLGAEYVNDAVVKLAAELTANSRVKLLHAAGKRD